MPETERLPRRRPEELDPPARAVYDRITGGPRASSSGTFRMVDDEGRLQGPFNAMLVAPALGDPLQELGAAIRYETSLDDRTRELAILLVASLRRSEFEWYAHSRVATGVGISASELEAIVRGQVPSSGLTEPERIVCELVVALVRHHDVDDASFAAAEEHLDERQLMEVVTLVGYYEMLASMLNFWRVSLPDGVTPIFGTAD